MALTFVQRIKELLTGKRDIKSGDDEQSRALVARSDGFAMDLL